MVKMETVNKFKQSKINFLMKGLFVLLVFCSALASYSEYPTIEHPIIFIRGDIHINETDMSVKDELYRMAERGEIYLGLEGTFLKRAKIENSKIFGLDNRFLYTLTFLPLAYSMFYQVKNVSSLKTYLFGGGMSSFLNYKEALLNHLYYNPIVRKVWSQIDRPHYNSDDEKLAVFIDELLETSEEKVAGKIIEELENLKLADDEKLAVLIDELLETSEEKVAGKIIEELETPKLADDEKLAVLIDELLETSEEKVVDKIIEELENLKLADDNIPLTRLTKRIVEKFLSLIVKEPSLFQIPDKLQTEMEPVLKASYELLENPESILHENRFATEVGLKLRDPFLAKSIAHLYSSAFKENKPFVAIVGERHVEGVSKLLIQSLLERKEFQQVEIVNITRTSIEEIKKALHSKVSEIEHHRVTVYPHKGTVEFTDEKKCKDAFKSESFLRYVDGS